MSVCSFIRNVSCQQRKSDSSVATLDLVKKMYFVFNFDPKMSTKYPKKLFGKSLFTFRNSAPLGPFDPMNEASRGIGSYLHVFFFYEPPCMSSTLSNRVIFTLLKS